MEDAFSKCHPAVNFLFFAGAIGFGEVDATGAAATGLLRTHGTTLGIVGPVLLHGILQDVVVAGYVGRLHDVGASAGGHGHRA